MRKACSSLSLLLVCLLAASGCGRSAKIKAHPVTGTVVSKGGAPLAGGTVSFQRIDDTQTSVVGVIKEDGTFSLHTLVQNDKMEGAAEGIYRVTVTPPVSADHTKTILPIALPRTFEVKPGENQFRIEVERPRRPR